VGARIQSKGDIESICLSADGGVAKLAFKAYDDASPPFMVKVRDPQGKMVVDRVIRELPTGAPQSPPPLTFSCTVTGEYRIQIRELYGKAEGEATLTVS
jgi:hypothetical protein